MLCESALAGFVGIAVTFHVAAAARRKEIPKTRNVNNKMENPGSFLSEQRFAILESP
jgi:hypothetical protein